jgi:hypothetical protein
MCCSIGTSSLLVHITDRTWCQNVAETLGGSGSSKFSPYFLACSQAGNAKGGSITVRLTSCLTDLESAV